jgi:hypothetical protein
MAGWPDADGFGAIPADLGTSSLSVPNDETESGSRADTYRPVERNAAARAAALIAELL